MPIFTFFSFEDPLGTFAITACAIALFTVHDLCVAPVLVAVGFNALAGVLIPADLSWTFALAAVAIAVAVTAVTAIISTAAAVDFPLLLDATAIGSSAFTCKDIVGTTSHMLASFPLSWFEIQDQARAIRPIHTACARFDVYCLRTVGAMWTFAARLWAVTPHPVWIEIAFTLFCPIVT